MQVERSSEDATVRVASGRDCGDSLSFEFDDHWRQVRRGSACSQSRLTHVSVHGVVAVDVREILAWKTYQLV